MASYFELPTQRNAEVASIQQVPKEERKQLRTDLMSPAVTQLLEDLEKERSDSDSSSDEGVLSEDKDEDWTTSEQKKTDSSGQSRQDKKTHTADRVHKPSSLSPSRTSPTRHSSRGPGHVQSSSVRSSGAGSARQKPAHMARFHSLRTMLFQANIEDKMKSSTTKECPKEEHAANKWKSQHEDRQMHCRPRTPEKEMPEKDGIGTRLKRRISRMTSKEGPSLQNIGEDGAVAKFEDRASTASSDAEDGPRHPDWKTIESDDESINHSDVEDLVRWVSRRDPPSDGEVQKGSAIHHEIIEDSGHESLGHSDVDDLVKWVSRRSDAKESREDYAGYSDASTESDSEGALDASDDDEEPDDLVRWISRRDGPKAGPVRASRANRDLESEVEQHYDSDVPELGRWFKRHDGTSGESAASSPVRERGELFGEEERGRPRSRTPPSPTNGERGHLRDDDVDELVRWVSRRDSKQQNHSTAENDERTMEWKRHEDAQKRQLGMTVDEGSLSHSDVKELIDHVQKSSLQDIKGSNASGEAESGDLRTLRAGQDDAQFMKRNEDAKKQQLGMTVDEGSLSHSDVQDLIAHVRKDSSSPQNDMHKINANQRHAADL